MIPFRISKIKLIVWGAFILANNYLFAQPPTGSPPSSPPAGVTGEPCWDQECIPIDSGIVFLIIGGILLGMKLILKIRASK